MVAVRTSHPALHRLLVVLALGLTALTTTLATTPVAASPTAPAVAVQADPDATLPPGGVTATQADDFEGPGPNAGGTTGLVVLLIVMTVIIGGAVILYVRHRPR